MSDGLANAPKWVASLRARLEEQGFETRKEQRFDQPFGFYAVLLIRGDLAVQIASDRAFTETGLMWRIDLMKARDADKVPRRTISPAALRTSLEGRQSGTIGEDTEETASWVATHLDEIASALDDTDS